jgi:hypothetical protein
MYAKLHDIIQKNRGLPDRFLDHPRIGERRSGKSDQTVWEKIIAAVERYDVDLPGYVFFAMRRISDTRRSGKLYPDMLLDQYLLDRYAHVRENEYKSVRFRWESQTVKFDTELQSLDFIHGLKKTGDKEKSRFILLSRSPVFSDLFLFYKSVLNDLPEVYEKIRDDALFQYSLFPTIYDDLIQSDFVIKTLLQKP